jgi:hypothetical protein
MNNSGMELALIGEIKKGMKKRKAHGQDEPN